MGKALALDTPLPTPTGWTTMGAVEVGDELYDADGRPTRVVAATEVMTGRPCYEIEFSDGSTIIADAEHQWLTETRASRRGGQVGASIVTTEHMFATLTVGAEARANHSVRNAQALQAPEADLPVAPYALGAWLGDGHSDGARMTSESGVTEPFRSLSGGVSRILETKRSSHTFLSDKAPVGVELLEREETLQGSGFTALLRKAGVLGDKHVPAAYLRASEAQRRELLAGLLDTDGTVVKGVGSCQFAVTSKKLADSVYELIVSLGYRCGRTTKRVHGRSEASSTCYILNFSTTDDVFWLERKRVLHEKERP